MKLLSLILRNFRGYRDETTVLFDDLIAIVDDHLEYQGDFRQKS